jgi:hypothetical protein
LLRAALLAGPAASAAWREWKSRVDVGQLDEGSDRMLPLVGHNLSRLGLEDPMLGMLLGMRRAVWMSNTLRLRETAAVLRLLHGAGVETLLLKGAALANLYYRDRGLRPMADTDVLVPTRQARAAMDVLAKDGWKPVGLTKDARRPELTIPVRHSHGFEHPSGQQVDLHWHVFWEWCAPDDDEDLWRHAVPLEVAGVRSRALGPADQLLHVCVHGARWSEVPPLRWAADALTVIRAPGLAVDWSRLLDQARARGFVPEMRDTLTFLSAALDAPVPPALLASLEAAPASRVDRVSYALRRRRPSLVGSFLVLLDHYRRLVRGRARGGARFGFGRYLLLTYERERLRDLVPVLREKRRIAGVRRRRRRATPSGVNGTSAHWLDRPRWEPVRAPVRSTAAARSREALLSVVAQFEVERSPRYQSEIRGDRRETWCNIFAWDVTRALGAEVPHWVDRMGRATGAGSGRELTANATVRWLETHGAANGWAEGDAPSATRAAEAGQPVLAVWQNPDGHGHVAVVVPSLSREPQVHVAQAGATCFSNGPLVEGFGARPVRFFIHP